MSTSVAQPVQASLEARVPACVRRGGELLKNCPWHEVTVPQELRDTNFPWHEPDVPQDMRDANCHGMNRCAACGSDTMCA